MTQSDAYDEEAAVPVDIAEDRPRGREVPPADPKPVRGNLVHVVVRGHKLATIDGKQITFGANLDLERCKHTRQFMAWLVKYANADFEYMEEILRPMDNASIFEFISEIDRAVREAIRVPK